MSELQQFIDDLEEELFAGINRRTIALAARDHRPSRLKPVLAVGIIMAAAIVAVFGIPKLVKTQPAAADAISITQLVDRVEIRVIDVVTDPDAVAAQLTMELGIRAEMVAVPVSPELVGHITAARETGTGTAEIDFGTDGLVELVILPKGFSNSLIIEYGRQAKPGEPYASTISDPLCASLFHLRPVESLSQLQATERSLRLATIADNGQFEIDVDPTLIPTHYQLVDIVAVSSDRYLITYAENPSTEPTHHNCE